MLSEMIQKYVHVQQLYCKDNSSDIQLYTSQVIIKMDQMINNTLRIKKDLNLVLFTKHPKLLAMSLKYICYFPYTCILIHMLNIICWLLIFAIPLL